MRLKNGACIFLVLCLIFLVGVAGGCQYASREGLEGVRADAVARLTDHRAELQSWLDAAESADTLEDREAALDVAGLWLHRIQLLEQGIERVDDALRAEERGTEGVMGQLTGWLPPPWNFVAAIGLGAGLTGWRAWKLKQALVQTTSGLERAKMMDVEFADAFDRTAAPILAGRQSKTAKRVVDEVQDDPRARLKLPI